MLVSQRPSECFSSGKVTFYSRMITDKAFAAMTSNGDVRLTFHIYKLSFLNFLIGNIYCLDRREDKGRRVCLGDRIYSFPCRASFFCTRMIWRKGWIHPNFLSRPVQNIAIQYTARNWKILSPYNSDDLCLLVTKAVLQQVF